MKRFLGIAACILLGGCAQFSVKQTDISPNERIITTEIKGTAYFSSAQAITKIKALQTEKSQLFNSDSIGQQGSTNSVAALQAIARILELIRPVPLIL